MISEKMAQRINEQINMELFSSYAYLAMAAYFKSITLNGFANWMFKQAEEEHEHAMKFFEYLVEQNANVTLKAIAQPQTEFASPLAVFEEALKHEQKVTASINQLVNLAVEEKDHATRVMLDWFVTEQVEEESSAREVVDKLHLLKDSPHGILLLDRELAARGS